MNNQQHQWDNDRRQDDDYNQGNGNRDWQQSGNDRNWDEDRGYQRTRTASGGDDSYRGNRQHEWGNDERSSRYGRNEQMSDDYVQEESRRGRYGQSYNDHTSYSSDRGYQGDYSRQQERGGRGQYGNAGYGSDQGDRDRNYGGASGRGDGYAAGHGNSYSQGSTSREHNYGSNAGYGRGESYQGSDRRTSESNYGGSGNYDSGYSGGASYGQGSTGGYGAAGSSSGQAGQHRGKGPRNYRRSDDRIREDINDRLSDDAHLDASDIEVTVSNGEITLSGTVESRRDKRRAEDIAESVSGVSNVENRIRVSDSYNSGSASGSSKKPGTEAARTSGGAASGTAAASDGAKGKSTAS